MAQKTIKNNKARTTKENAKEEENDKLKRRIMMIIIIILIILSLITSCSCTSNFFGRIGNMFRNEGTHNITDDPDNKETIKNGLLKFETDTLEIALSDAKAKLGFTYKDINPKEYTCMTSDANVATCYVEDNYVVINPKTSGIVTVTLRTETNGKIYEATATVTITDTTKYISLANTSGTINLFFTKEKSVNYSLVGLIGNVTVSSSDESIATAVAKDGVLKVTAYKTGKVDITLSLNYNGIEYKVVYNLTVINNSNTGNNKPGNLDGNNRLKELSMAWTDFHFDPDTLEYRVGVKWRDKVSIKAVPESKKAKVTYTFNGKTVSDLKNLELNLGDNIVTITVTAENGSKRVYKVIINKTKSSDVYLKSLVPSNGKLEPKFDKNQLSYTIDVDKNVGTFDLDAIPNDKKSTLSYTFNGRPVTSLDNLILRDGPNYITITVTAEDGSARTYNVTVNKEPNEVDRNSLLESLTDSLGKIDFNPYQSNYTIGVDSKTDDISFTAIPSSKDATISYTFNGKTVDDLSNLELLPGDNTVVITVTAPDGVTKSVYTVIINKALDDKSNSLMNLEVIGSDAKLVPDFDENTLGYTINVTEKTEKISLEATPNSNSKSISYTYNGHTRENLNDLPLDFGNNTVVITVTGNDGTKRNYTVTITRTSSQSHDASLKNVTVDGKSIIGSMSTTVSKDTDSVNLVATPTDPNASITYYYNGIEYKDVESLKVDLKPGANSVSIIVTAEDGVTKVPYTVTIIKEEEVIDLSKDTSLEILTINGEDIKGSYKKEISADEIINSIVAKAHHEKATVSFLYKDKFISLDDLKQKLNDALKSNEKVDFKVRVTAEDTTVWADYPITINKTSDIDEKDNNFLDSLKVKDDLYLLNPTFNKGTNNYEVQVAYNESKITLEATKNKDAASIEFKYKKADGTETTIKSLNDLELADGVNTVTIVVTSKNGVANTYTVKITKPVRTIEFLENNYECNIEKGTCTIKYKVKDDGHEVTNYELNAIEVGGLPNGVTAAQLTTLGEIVLNIDSTKVSVGTSANITLGIKNYKDNLASTTVTFTSSKHYITSDSYEYDMSYDATSKDNSQKIILRTDVLIGDLKVTESADGKNLTMCTGNNCVVLTATGPIKISYSSETSGPTNLAIKIEATGATQNDNPATISAKGSMAFGKELTFPDGIDVIKINVTEKFIVKLNANGGVFNATTDEYEFKISAKEEIDLTKYDIPYKVSADDKCQSFKFAGYSENKDASADGPFDYTYLEPNNIIKTDRDITLYAIYKDTATPIDPEEKVLGVVDIPLFHNKEYFEKYNESKVIYPGAEGEYTMEINNKSKDTIVLTGMTLREDKTVCIKNNDGSYMGCLNMGYIINDNLGQFHMGASGKYDILNSYNGSFQSWPDSDKTVKVNFAEDKKITLKPESIDRDASWTEITLHWKWVDYEDGHTDILDTKIGNIAAELSNKPAIKLEEIDKLLYALSIGIHYEVIDGCQITNN